MTAWMRLSTNDTQLPRIEERRCSAHWLGSSGSVFPNVRAFQNRGVGYSDSAAMGISVVVSVLLCTHNSRKLLPIAIHSYLSQDYKDTELVVIDDGDDLIEDLVTGIAGLQYHHFPARNLSEKRNYGLKVAKGDTVVHFDSDDWSAPDRISHQVDALNGRKVVGYVKAWWYDTRKKIASYANTGLWGASLCYDRKWALKHPWDERKYICEDAWFLEPAREQGVVGELEGGNRFVALAHDGNMERPFGHDGWGIVASDRLPAGFRSFMEI